jgi:hypothetical protein
MSFGTLLTLFVVPVVYLIFARQSRVVDAPVPEPVTAV